MTKKHQDTEEPIDELTKRCDEYLHGWKRALADYENYKKEVLKSREESRVQHIAQIAYDVLPIIDTFQEAMKHIPETERKSGWYQGLQHVLTQWNDFQRQYGIEAIEQTGTKFDPTIHEAVEMVEHKDKKDDEIITITKAGYKVHDTLIRPARVTVNKLKDMLSS